MQACEVLMDQLGEIELAQFKEKRSTCDMGLWISR